jgi:hypothetical protein
MKIPRLKTGFGNTSDAAFEIKASHVDVSMDGNENFLSPTPQLSVVTEALQAYHVARIAAKDKSKNAIAAKKEARNILTALLIQLANYVMTTANGDQKKLISSGFDLARKGETSPIVKPASISVTEGENAGELMVKVPRAKGASGYVTLYTPDPISPDSVWKQLVSSTSKNKIQNLESATRYWVKIGVVGPHGQLVFSDPISRVAQ